MQSLILPALILTIAAAAATASAAPPPSPSASAVKEMSLLMPAVAPTEEDTYLCTAVKLDSERYIREFNPQHQSGHAHHIILTACREPGSTDKVWNCGEMLSQKAPASGSGGYKVAPQCSADTRIIYAYAMDAPALKLPEDVTFGVGPKFGLPWLVVQVHYKHAADFAKNPGLTDSSGVKLAYQTTPSPKLGGVHLSVTDGVIPAHSVTHLETSCSYTGKATIHPFAFRTHTHILGRVVSGFRIRDGRWSLIGSANPQQPQMFYPVNGTGSIRPGDQIAAKCVMENKGDADVSIGATQKDEMCNFYTMYWIPAADVGKDGDHLCFASGELWDLAPQEVSDLTATIPGTGRILKEFNREMSRLDQDMEGVMAREMDMSEPVFPGFEEEQDSQSEGSDAEEF